MKLMQIKKMIPFLLLVPISFACSSPKHFGDGEYIAADYSDPKHFDDKFNEYDSKKLIETALKEFAKCEDKKEVLMATRFDNQTSELIDTVLLQRELNDEMAVRGYKVVDKTSRPDLLEEYTHETDAPFTDTKTTAKLGKQLGVKYILRVALVSKVQTDQDLKTVRYKLTIQSVDMQTALVACNGIAEIKKMFERVKVGL